MTRAQFGEGTSSERRSAHGVRGAVLSRARDLSPGVKLAARAVISLPAEVADRVSGRRDPLVPPRRLWFVGGGADFVSSGRRLAGQIADVTELADHDRVLEVGCGIGRIAGPMTGHIGPEGSYDGFDIVGRAIRWCQRNITPRHPNFNFRHADVYNRKYNPRGTISPAEYRFPYADGSFDVVYLTSVFTHMLHAEVEHYTGEIARVLAPGGRAFLTYFLLDDDVRARMASGASTLVFDVPVDGAMTIHAGTPETAVAFEEADVRQMLTARGLAVGEPVRYGSWSGREDFLTYQDVVLAQKVGTGES